MNELIIEELTKDLNVRKEQVIATLKLLEEGATIPFIARYRKEATGALDENQIKSIGDLYTYYNNLLDIITKASSSGIIIDSISTINKSDYKVYNMTVLVENKEKLEKFMSDLLNLKFVQKVERSVN